MCLLFQQTCLISNQYPIVLLDFLVHDLKFCYLLVAGNCLPYHHRVEPPCKPCRECSLSKLCELLSTEVLQDFLMGATRRIRPFFSAIPIRSKCYRGQLAHGLPVTLYYPIQRVGLGRQCFFTVVTLVPLRMVMLLRDLHYDHLDIVEGHRQRGCSDMVAGNTGLILTEAGPSVHGVLLVAQLFCSSKVNFHLDLGATPSVQATVHQMGTSFTFLSYHFVHIARLGAVALTVLVGQLSCATPQVLQFGDKLGGSQLRQLPGGHQWCHIEVPAGWPSESTQ